MVEIIQRQVNPGYKMGKTFLNITVPTIQILYNPNKADNL